MHKRGVAFFVVCLFLISPVIADESNLTPRWEITNRFAPFEVLDNPSEVFRRYQVPDGSNGLDGWHSQLQNDGGMTSPYAQALEAGGRLPWIAEDQRHHPELIRYVKQERLPSTTISIDFWVDGGEGLECSWSFLSEPVPCLNDDNDRLNGVEHRVPLSGAELSVEIDGTTYEFSVEPEHVVIVGLGDSYGSGEGNPDVPARWLDRDVTPDDIDWLTDERRIAPSPESRWLDERCHRSFFSQQSLTALTLASQSPHRFVSFLHYACTGAEIFDGLLSPQWQPDFGQNYQRFSQVNAAVRALCLDNPQEYLPVTQRELSGLDLEAFDRRGSHVQGVRQNTDLRPRDALDLPLANQARASQVGAPRSGFLDCRSQRLRPPDYVFVSIGGNDVGFAELVRYWLVPHEKFGGFANSLVFPDLCPQRGNRGGAAQPNRHCSRLDRRRGVERPYDAGTMIDGRGVSGRGGIAERYELLFRILQNRLGVDAEQIVMPQYPDPLRASAPEADVCDPLTTDDLIDVGGDTRARRYDPLSPWEGLKSVTPEFITGNWHFNLTTIGQDEEPQGFGSEAHLLLRQIDDFRTVFADTAQRAGITIICETRDAFVGYGWWQGRHHNLPSHGVQWNVADWRPYAFERVTRAIRTGNDSVLTQPMDQRSISGTAHPNLTGHRLVAQIVADRLIADRQAED